MIVLVKGLTKKQQAILDYIKSELQSKGYPPSIREICDAVGVTSSSTVHGHLTNLEKKGFIRRDPTKPRAIEILGSKTASKNENFSSDEMISVPIVGEVAAGVPITAEENIIDTFPVPLNFFPSANPLFMLKVKGDSMIDVGIFENDYLLIEQKNTANNGEIVVAIVNDGYESEATVKRMVKKNGMVELHAENENYAPIIAQDVNVVGTVAGLFRRF